MKISSAGLLKAGSAKGMTPDFKIYTSAMEIDKERENIVRMIGSSTEQDLHGDTMALSALTDMAQVDAGLTIWLNHSYDLPNDLFGSLLEKPELRLKDTIADLHLVSDVEMENPNAVQTLKLIKNGRKLGCSIGCIILEAEIDEENDDGRSWWPPIIILHVLVLEFSVVGIPANQRSWVEAGMKGLFERMAKEGRGDEALKLAPAIKGLYPRQYEDYLKGLEDLALRRDLERIEVRGAPKQRVEWDPFERTFVMNQRGAYKSLDRNEVAALVAKGLELPRDAKLDPIQEAARKLLQEGPGTKAEWSIDSQDSTEDTQVTLDNDVQEQEIPDSTATLDSSEAPAQGVTAEAEQSAESSEEVSENKETQGDIAEEQGEAEQVNESQEVTEEPCVTSEEKESEPLAELDKLRFESVTDPLDVQLFNALAARLGQPQIFLGIDGEIIADRPVPPSIETIQEVIAKALSIVEATKAGNKLSKENRERVQDCHDALVSMAGSQWDPCEGLDGSSDSEDIEEGEKSARLDLHPLQERIDCLCKAMEGFEFKEIKALQGQVLDLQSCLKDIEARAKTIEEQASATEETIAKLKDMPLGQPTTFSNRTVRTGPETASYNELSRLSAPSMNGNERRWSLEEALKETMVVPRTLPGGETLNYRKWPDGVGGSVQSGVRPELTGTQRAWMHPMEMLAYNDGDEAAVPCYDDPDGVSA